MRNLSPELVQSNAIKELMRMVTLALILSVSLINRAASCIMGAHVATHVDDQVTTTQAGTRATDPKKNLEKHR